ncbi:MAG: phosphoglucosamine mutase, partial [Planctomycetota bacterium]
MSKTLFGTDGIRGVAGEYPLVPELLEKLGRVLAMRILGDLPDNADAAPRVLIGHDGRESGETIAAAVAAGLTHGGVPVDVVGLTSTPCLAYLTFADCYQAGVMVSASHNPARDNGIKLFGRQGTKLADAVEAELETALAEVGPPPEGVA